MGILRFLLAFAVFNAHAGLPIGFGIVAGSTAVHCFFVISGFYMAMVLREKYVLGSTGYFDFVSSRFLRLVPSYLVVVGVTIALAICAAATGLRSLPPLDATQHLVRSGAGFSVHLLNAMSQITLLGQDFYYFLKWSPASGLGFTPSFLGAGGVHNLLVVPPAWSLSVEIYFYLLAPWLVRARVPVILALITASFACRGILAWSLGWQGDPWSYRFFPSELAFFLTGALAYRINAHIGMRKFPWTLFLLLLGSALGLAETLAMWEPGMPLQRWIRVPLFAFLAAGTPQLFAFTKDWRFDRAIGELSYPLYVSHFLVIWVVGLGVADASSIAGRTTVISCAILTALALRTGIDVPVDRYRQVRLSKRTDSARGREKFESLAPSGLVANDLQVLAGK